MAASMGGLTGILKWSLAHTDGTSPSPVTAMSEETKKWLQEAMEHSITNPVDEMKIIMQVLQLDSTQQPTDTEEEIVKRKVEALEQLIDYVEDLDLAQDFVTLKGFELLQGVLDCEYPILRSGAAAVFAAVVQNHEKMQTEAMKTDIMPTLVRLIGTAISRAAESNELSKGGEEDDNDASSVDSNDVKAFAEDQQELVKLLLAISCFIRNCPMACKAFLYLHSGMDILQQLISFHPYDPAVDAKLQQKAYFLLHFLAREKTGDFVSKANANLVYPPILSYISSDRCPHHVLDSAVKLLDVVSTPLSTRGHMGSNTRSIIDFLQSQRNKHAALPKEEQDEELLSLLDAVKTKMLQHPVLDEGVLLVGQ